MNSSGKRLPDLPQNLILGLSNRYTLPVPVYRDRLTGFAGPRPTRRGSPRREGEGR